jgi:uncharacterized membrane protein
MVKHLSRTESANAIVTYMVLLMTPMSLAPALFVWQMPPVWTWAFLVGMGLAGTLGHLCYVRALRMSDASAVLPYDYGRMIFSAFIGYLAFAEIRFYGASNIQIARRLRAMIINLANTLPIERHAALRLELDLLDRMLEKLYVLPEDLALARIPDSQGLGGSTEAKAPKWAA